MNSFFRIGTALLALFVFTPVGHATIFEISPDMQACSGNEDCVAVSDSCTKSCETTPVNTASVEKLSTLRDQSCGEQVKDLPKCKMYPPLEPRCVNNRCTVGYAFDHASDSKDYGATAGGYGGSGSATGKKSTGFTDGPGYLELPAGYAAQPAKPE